MAQEITIRQCTSPKNCPEWAIENHIDNALRHLDRANTAIESACLAPNGTFFLRRDHREAYKAACSLLYNHIEGVEFIFENMAGMVLSWGLRARYFEPVTMSAIERLPSMREKSTCQARTTSLVRSLLHDNGRLDPGYVDSFREWQELLEEPIQALKELVRLLTSLRDCSQGRPCSITTITAREAGVTATDRGPATDSSDEGSNSSDSRPQQPANINQQTHGHALVHTHAPGAHPSGFAAIKHPQSDPLTEEPTPFRALQQTTSPRTQPHHQTPYWRVRLSRPNHNASTLNIHPDNNYIYSHALKLAHQALHQVTAVEKVCVEMGDLADQAGKLWQGYWDAVKDAETAIERRYRRRAVDLESVDDGF